MLGIYDNLGDLIADTDNDDGGARLNSRLYFTASRYGTYHVAAGAWQGDTGSYKLLVEEVTHVEDYETDTVPTETVSLDKTVDDYPADPGSAGTVAVGGSATGEIERAGDEDWFAIELIAGRRYQIDLEGWWTGRGTLVDPYLCGIHDSDGNLIANTDDDDGGTGLNSSVYFVAPDSGAYYIAAGAFGEHIGTYTVGIVDVL